MAEAAKAEDRKGAPAVHRNETREPVKRVERVFELLRVKPESVECKAIKGILDEGHEVEQQFSGGDALDTALIAGAQAVEHYEIARYGTLLACARHLGPSEVQDILRETLVKEEKADEILSELAEDAINPAAASAGQ